MNLSDIVTLYANLGNVGVKSRHHGVISKPMQERGGHTQIPSEHQHDSSKHGHGGHQHSTLAKDSFMRKSGAGHTGGGDVGKARGHGGFGKHHHLSADASPSDLASHHLWQEPSSTDVTIQNWRAKRQLEKKMGRNLDPFEADYERQMFGAAEVTGPCGCTLKLGETVNVEFRGLGVIKSRSNRVLTVDVGGRQIQVDQRFVHRSR